jgi:hypothetical protein
MKPKTTKKVVYRSSGTPAIIIAGLFLENYGFEIGDRVAINYFHHGINIAKIIESQPEK